MSWVTDRVEEERKARAAMPAPQKPYIPPRPAWLSVWDSIIALTHVGVRDFNKGHKEDQFRVSAWPMKSVRMEVITLPAAHRVATLVLQETDEHSGEIGLVVPPEGEGIGRHGNFRIRGGTIEALPHFVGTPQPPTTQMTAAEFVRFMLEPLLFPNKK